MQLLWEMLLSDKPIWMVRAGKNAAFVEDFVDGSFVGIGFHEAGEVSMPVDREALVARIASEAPSLSQGKVDNIASQVKRFYEELSVGDAVTTYDPNRRLYYLGEILSEGGHRDHELSRARSVR